MSDQPPPREELEPEAAPSKRQFPFSSRKPPPIPPARADADHEAEGTVVRTLPPTPPASADADHDPEGILFTPPPPASASQLPLKQTSYAADHEAESNEWNSSHGHLDVVNSPAQTSAAQNATPNLGPPGNNLTLTDPCRNDTSLGVLAKKFVDMIKHAEDGTISVKEAVETLKGQKRRIYDVTNVLEGTGLIEKTSMGKFQWKGHCTDTLQKKMKDFSQDENNQRRLFVTEDDIKSLPCFHNQALIAIKAPDGTTIEVPNPDEAADFPQRRYRLILTSTKGAIGYHLVSQFESQDVEPPPSYPSTSAIEETRATTTVIRGKGIQMRGQDNQPTCADLNTSQDFTSQILDIFPSNTDTNADYWLFSDRGVGIKDMFCKEVVDWSEFGALSHEDHGIDNVSMTQHQTSPSNTTSLSLELSELGELPDDYLTDKPRPQTPPSNTTGVPPPANTSPGDWKSPRG